MPWYWTDDLAQTLLASGQIDPEVARRLKRAPVAIWGAERSRDQRSEENAAEEDAASKEAGDDELPQVA